MKRITFIICFLYSFCCFSHVNESFLDGIFNLNSIWKGDTSLFSTLPSGETRQIAGQLPGVLFSDHLSETPSPGFGSVIFNEIMANPNNVNGLPESEYIELYNRTDSLVSLKNSAFYYDGKRYSLPEITIESKKYAILCNQKYKDLWAASGISVTGVPSFPTLLNTGKLLWLEDAQGNLISWIEYSDSWYNDSNKKEGGYSLECIDPNNLSNDASNWQATNDVKGGTPGTVNSVRNSFPDKSSIIVLSSFLQSPDTLVLNFSKSMNVSSLAKLNNYSSKEKGVLFTEAIPDYPRGRNVKLVLKSPLNAGEKADFELRDLLDASGNQLLVPIDLQTLLPEKIEVGDVLFNEILFNPREGGASYIELSNISDKILSYNQLSLSFLKEDGTHSVPIALSKYPVSFPQHSEAFFTKKKAVVSSQYNCDASHGVEILEFPDFSKEKGTLFLLSAQGDLLDEIAYSKSMHNTLLEDKRGISLEKKAPGLISADSLNWASAAFLSGYGTPGLPNKCTEQTTSSVNANFWLEKNSFSPTDSENNKLQIHYLLSKEGFMANIRIFEASGREICSLAQNNELSADGTIEWDGKEQNSNMCRVGLYIAYIEIHNTTGEMKRYKIPFALVR